MYLKRHQERRILSGVKTQQLMGLEHINSHTGTTIIMNNILTLEKMAALLRQLENKYSVYRLAKRINALF